VLRLVDCTLPGRSPGAPVPCRRAIPPSSSRPASGRAQATTSRGRDTSSRERGLSPSSSRPSSAPAARSGPRFDPTEYVKQQRERLERRSSGGGSSRNPTPPRSQASSVRASPVNSRPTSAERPRGYSPMSNRPSSTDRARGAGGWPLTVDVQQSRSRASECVLRLCAGVRGCLTPPSMCAVFSQPGMRSWRHCDHAFTRRAPTMAHLQARQAPPQPAASQPGARARATPGQSSRPSTPKRHQVSRTGSTHCSLNY
jgi:hypothetical protein